MVNARVLVTLALAVAALGTATHAPADVLGGRQFLLPAVQRSSVQPAAATVIQRNPAQAGLRRALDTKLTRSLALSAGKLMVAGPGFVGHAADDGTLQDSFSVPVQDVRGLAPFRAGLLLLADGALRGVHEVDPVGHTSKLLFRLNDLRTDGVQGADLIRFGDLSGVASDGGNVVFVSTEAGFSSSIFKIDASSGRVLQQAFAPGPTPRALQFDGGNLFVADEQSGLLRRFDPALRLSMATVKLPLESVRGFVVQGDQMRLLTPERPTVPAFKANFTGLLQPISMTRFVLRPELIKIIAAGLLPQKYAVLICGDVAESGFDCFWNDTVWMYKMLRAKGFLPENIFVLYGDGHDYNCPNPFYRTPEVVTDFPATVGWVGRVLTGLKVGDAAAKIPAMKANDKLFIWTFDHGASGPPGTTYLCLRDGWMSNLDFAARANAIPYASRAVFCQQCFSGGFIPPLRNAKTYVSTASRADETAHVADAERELVGGRWYTHGEYNYYVIAAFGGSYPTGAGAPADANGNGKVSAREANAWWVSHENRAETPQEADDGGVGLSFVLQ